MGGKTRSIKVSNYVYQRLLAIKEGASHTSIDSVIRSLLYEYERRVAPIPVATYRLACGHRIHAGYPFRLRKGDTIFCIECGFEVKIDRKEAEHLVKTNVFV